MSKPLMVQSVNGDPKMIHFTSRDHPPIAYELNNLMRLPVHVARRAVELAEIEYMNKHFQHEVKIAVGNPYAVLCIEVSEERATWEVFPTSISSQLRLDIYWIVTDIDGNLIDTH